VLVSLGLAGQVAAQDFQKTYPVGAGGSISIENVSGDVNIIGGEGGEVPTVTAFKEGRDRDKVEVVDLSSGNSVKLKVRYQRNCNCDASIRFEVRLPRSIRYDIFPVTTASGNITVRNVNGDVRVNTASGNITVRDITGTVNAQSASGDVNVEIDRVEGAQRMNFSTASGNVNVKLPDSPDAEVSMSTASGSVKTDFPIDVDKNEYGAGQSAHGRLGNGTVRLKLSSASGNVSLTRM
jgi:hypothetical protein